MGSINYSSVTEYPGQRATIEQLERLYQRYKFAKNYTEDKQVLEIACGSGIGLIYLAENAKKTIGIDIDDNNLAEAGNNIKKSIFSDKISIFKMDAHKLEFGNEYFDLIIVFEAIYYIKNLKESISEIFRVLKNGGICVIGSVNKNWESFHPSPFTHKYLTIPEYQDLFMQAGFKKIEYFGGFYTNNDLKWFSLIKKMANKLNLIPKSLKARALLKRIFIGKLHIIPNSIHDSMAKYTEPEKIYEVTENKDYKIIYITAEK